MCGGANPAFKPFQNICEFLTAVHIYTDEARQGKTRYVDAVHYCAHVRKDLRQCLIYDSHEKDARLIGVEYMVPKAVYLTFTPEEQNLWHSHHFEISSGLLILPKLEGYTDADWEAGELEAMKEITNLYGKTWHFWQVDAGHRYPTGRPLLMGSLTQEGQLDLDVAMKKRNDTFGVDHKQKAATRKGIDMPGPHENADSWWKEISGKL